MIFNDSGSIVAESQSDVAEKRTDSVTGHRSLFTKKNFNTNDVISKFYWDEIFPTPTYLTVQVGEDKHILLKPEYLDCINHSCDPNAFFDTARKELVCLKPIKAGEQFTFFYPSAEWDMDQAFQCQCGSDKCIGMIKGARYLSDDLVRKYRFTDYIQGKLKARTAEL